MEKQAGHKRRKAAKNVWIKSLGRSGYQGQTSLDLYLSLAFATCKTFGISMSPTVSFLNFKMGNEKLCSGEDEIIIIVIN